MNISTGGVPSRLRRSALYLPASNQRAIAKARGLDADIVILDLEDAVAPEAKALAREQAVAALAAGPFGGSEVVVRINGLDTEWGRDDLAALAAAGAAAVLVPKVSGPAELDACAHALGPQTALWAMIETPRGVLRIGDIVATHAPLAGLVVGANDLVKDARFEAGANRAVLLPILAGIVLAARAYGLAVLDGVFNALDDPEGLAAECRQARAYGFDGKTLIHPSQLALCHAAFAPDAAEIAEAQAVLALFDAPENAGKGAVRHNGRMVERLHLEAARRVLELAGRG